MKRSLAVVLLSLGIIASLVTTRGACGQDDEEPLVTKVYSVSDLVVPTPNYGFRGLKLPGLDDSGPAWPGLGAAGGGMGFGGGGGMGGMGGMGGGGFFSVPNTASDSWQLGMGAAPGQMSPPAASGFRFGLVELIDTIVATIDPTDWHEVGGPGSITSLGSMLVIRQTPRVHQAVSEFLDALRETGGAVTSVTIHAHWLLLDTTAFRKLAPVNDFGKQTVDRRVLDELAPKSGARGQLTCFDGQTVHIISGNIRSSVTGVTPVVGQLDAARSQTLLAQRASRPSQSPSAAEEAAAIDVRHYLAQVKSGPATSDTGGSEIPLNKLDVGYQPVTKVVNFGAVLQVTPALIPGTDAAMLDVQSTVIRRHPEIVPPVQFAPIGTLQRLNLVAQQFMTTLRVRLDQPVLVGGSTLEPISDAGKDEQLYLIIEASAAKAAKED